MSELYRTCLEANMIHSPNNVSSNSRFSDRLVCVCFLNTFPVGRDGRPLSNGPLNSDLSAPSPSSGVGVSLSHVLGPCVLKPFLPSIFASQVRIKGTPSCSVLHLVLMRAGSVKALQRDENYASISPGTPRHKHHVLILRYELCSSA